MKIAHIVTLVSPDGAFGGPVRVATNLAREMADAGHDVTILGSYRGYDAAPTEIDGVPARFFRAYRALPGLGFSGLIAPGLMTHLVKSIAEYDVVHVHVARDLITLPSAVIAKWRGVPYALQTHGMIDSSQRRLANVLDALATRAALKAAAAVFYLTEREHDDLIHVARTPALRLSHLANGVPESDLQADVTSGDEVLFLARLHVRKRPLAFVTAAVELRKKFPNTKFTLVGPDEGEANETLAFIKSANAGETVSWQGPLEPQHTLKRMSGASIYVLPSVDEPFPMAVLEAMSIGLPCVVTDTCGLIPRLRDPNAVAVVDESTDALVAELARLLSDTNARASLGSRARREVESYFSIDQVAATALNAYYEFTRPSHVGD